MDTSYLQIVKHYEHCLEQHGDTYRGVDWPRAEDVDTRYAVMLDVIRPPADSPITLLDFGCGGAHLYDYLRRYPRGELTYSGLDASAAFIQVCRGKFPDVSFYAMDVLEDDSDLPDFDYVVMNGVFTERRSLSFDQMLAYMEAVLERVFRKARVGIAFNVMSSHVDWERDDLFHVPFDRLADFIQRSLSRHYLLRNDYGLYEYTAYVYQRPLVRGEGQQ